MADAPGAGSFRSLEALVNKRPAELTTAAAGGVGLLLATALGGNEDVVIALVVILALLPAVVTYLRDLSGRGRRAPKEELLAELDEFALRALRRARIHSHTWETDVVALKALGGLARSPEDGGVKSPEDGGVKSPEDGGVKSPEELRSTPHGEDV